MRKAQAASFGRSHRIRKRWWSALLGTRKAGLGRHREAVDAQRRALALWSENYGAEHIETGLVRKGLALSLQQLGDHDEAEERLRIAIATVARTDRPNSKQMAELERYLADVRSHGRDNAR